jgi:hypothetical protein
MNLPPHKLEAHSSDPNWIEGLADALKAEFNGAVSFMRGFNGPYNGRSYKLSIWIWDRSRRQAIIDCANRFNI